VDRPAVLNVQCEARLIMRRIVCIAACGLLALSVNAQAPPVIRTNVPLVLVPVTVMDRKGSLIDGLSVDDFILTDDGVRQKVRLDTSDTVLAPVSVVVAVQSSDISAAALAKINKVGGMIQPLIAGEKGEAAVVAFDDEIRTIQEFTKKSEDIRGAFQKIHGRGSGSGKMLDAVAQATAMLDARPRNHRKILILLSEVRDRGSKTKLEAALEGIARAGILVYPATYSAYLTPWTAKSQDNPPTGGGLLTGLMDLIRLGSANTADALAKTSGGEHFSFTTLRGLEDRLTRTGEEIHGQYLLSFVPGESDNNGFHKLDVAVLNRAGAVVRTRAGYWAR
jgi:VWFA-related protein